MEEYKTLRAPASDEFTEKRSRFIGYAQPVSTQVEAAAFIERIKKQHHDATHNVFAYLLREGQLERYSDDGEPQGTAGIPMLEVFRRAGVTNAVCVVTRYFGGVLLGTGGLVRAYQGAVQAGLASSTIIDKKEGIQLTVGTDYTGLGKLQYLIAQQNLTLIDTVYTEKVELQLMVPVEQQQEVEKEIVEATNGSARISWGGKVLYALVDKKIEIFEKNT